MLFKNIKLIEPLQKALEKNQYITATPIQAKSIPEILKGKDLIGIAQTGTGKTAAFTLPILQLMYERSKKVTFTSPKTLILTPTRELASQIGESFASYGKFTPFKQTVIFGGVKQDPQVRTLKKGVDIIVATPGRLLDLMNQGLVNLTEIEYLILDEADRMLDMGFIHDIKRIVKKLPVKKQTLFFSATMPKAIIELTNKFLKNPVKIEIAPESTTIEKINQTLYFIDKENKNKLLLDLLAKDDVKSTIVFTRTKSKSNAVAKFLTKNNIAAEAIHGNKSQNARTRTMTNFKTGKIKVLLATEIVARGIDIDDISHVINYELPNEPESYVHRIGRTARAGNSGIAFSFCSADERNYLSEIEKTIKMKIPVSSSNKFHSNSAQNAKGSAAKPPKKVPFQRNKNKTNSNSFSNNRSNNKSSNESKEIKTLTNKYKKDNNSHKSENKPFKKPYSKNNSNSKRSNSLKSNNQKKPDSNSNNKESSSKENNFRTKNHTKSKKSYKKR